MNPTNSPSQRPNYIEVDVNIPLLIINLILKLRNRIVDVCTLVRGSDYIAKNNIIILLN